MIGALLLGGAPLTGAQLTQSINLATSNTHDLVSDAHSFLDLWDRLQDKDQQWSQANQVLNAMLSNGPNSMLHGVLDSQDRQAVTALAKTILVRRQPHLYLDSQIQEVESPDLEGELLSLM